MRLGKIPVILFLGLLAVVLVFVNVLLYTTLQWKDKQIKQATTQVVTWT